MHHASRLAPLTPIAIFRRAIQAHKRPTIQTLFVFTANLAISTVTRITAGSIFFNAVYTDPAPTFFASRHEVCALVCA
jgi:hypothetical protein